jgi:hypothetical protein
MEDRQLAKIDLLIDTAAAEGIDAALEKHGEVVNGREAMALAKLSREELQTFAKINSKIIDTAKAGKLATDWSCGVLC